MSSGSEHVHLNNHHRTTLAKIFQHPISHNLEWKDVLSLLAVVGTVEEKHDGKYSVSVGSLSETLERPNQKEVNAQELLDVRKLFTSAGYGPTSA
jgi:hypothetical protein